MALRIGILGAARIAPTALVRPAQELRDVLIVAVAARELSRAQQFAAKHRIPRAHGSYQALIEDPEIDAIYNPLPNSLHARWTLGDGGFPLSLPPAGGADAANRPGR
jgi:predicted dehydrogenase